MGLNDDLLSQVEKLAEEYCEREGDDCLCERTTPGTKFGEHIYIFCGCTIHEAYLAGARAVLDLLAEKAEGELPPHRIWFGDACDEWALSPTEGWEEYAIVADMQALRARDAAKITEMEAQLAAAKEALEFYANGFAQKLTDSMMGINTPALGDGGRIAREALAKLAEGEK